VGYRRLCQSGLRVLEVFFSRCFKGARWVKTAVRRACARPAGRRRTTVTPSRETPLQPAEFHTRCCPGGKPCGLSRTLPGMLTSPLQSLHSANDSGGREEAAAFVRQTGNSGVNPGRPRRCDQAPRPAVSSHCGACAGREKACSRLSLGVRRPTRCQESAGPRGRNGGHGRVIGRSQGIQDPLLQAPASLTVARAPACVHRGRACACGAAVAWTRSLRVGASA
jgi:hypothetical protein